MKVQTTPLRRAVAILLCVQPVFWVSGVALAQALQQPVDFSGLSAGSGASTAPTPTAPGDTEIVRSDRGSINSTVAVPGIPLEEPLDPNTYICGRGDTFELNFWGIQNFRLRVSVDIEGRAFVSKVGYVDLRGKTLTEARQILKDAVGKYYPRLNFDVTLAEMRLFLVNVVEYVGHPGTYPAHLVDRVSTVIAQAGGVGKGGSVRRIEIHRRDGSVLYGDLLMYSLTGDGKYNPRLLDGDVIKVPVEGVAASIAGAVHRPGRYELTGTRDLAELLELAGGLSPAVTKRLPIRLVRRMSDDHDRQAEIDFNPDGSPPALPLRHEDAVNIPGYGELQRSVFVIGAVAGASAPDEVSATRRVSFVEGDTVRTLLNRVGGIGPLADLGGCYIFRSGEVIPVDLYTLLVVRDLTADRAVELGDAVVVPFKRRSISVAGAVFVPGLVPYNPTFGIEQYLAMAGGRNRYAQPLSEVRLITPQGETKEYVPGLKVEPGASLVVPERNFSRSETVQILLSVAGALLSGVALVIVARK